MNPLRSGIPVHDNTASLSAAQLAESARQPESSHPRTLTLAGTSRNTLFALQQTNETHQLLAMSAINLIADNALHFHSDQGASAIYATENGNLSIEVKLNEQSHYDIVSISSPTETIHLSVPPPATAHRGSSSAGERRLPPSSHLAAQQARGQLAHAKSLQTNALNISEVSAISRRRGRIISNISDNQLRNEAQEMYRGVEALNYPDEFDEHLEMLQWIHEDEEKAPTLVELPESNFKISSGGMTVGLMTISVDMKNKEGTEEDDKKHTLWVDQIVTMPNTRGNGKELIAKALNSSENNGYGGIVRAVAKSSPDFYARLGFREINGQVCELDPSQSPNWNKINGEWQFSA